MIREFWTENYLSIRDRQYLNFEADGESCDWLRTEVAHYTISVIQVSLMPNQKTSSPNLRESAVMRNQNNFSRPILCINTSRSRAEALPMLSPTQINPLKASGVERGTIHIQKSERCSSNWDYSHDSYHEIVSIR